MSRWWLIFAPFAIVCMLTIGCHRGSASAGLDASADTSVVASPCAWPGQRAPSFMSALELQSLIQRCTAQAVEATHPVSRVEVGTSRQMLVYAQLVGGRRTLSAVGRPLGLSTRPLRVGHHGFTCRGWPESRTQAGHARARFDTLAGETVIVEALTTEVYGFKAGIISVPWERVWRKRGKTLVELGRYALGGSADGEKPTDPTPCVRQGTLSR